MKDMKFFEKQAGFDRESFQNKLKEAIALVAKNRSREAKQVTKIIKEKKVNIASFFDLTKDHYNSLKNDFKEYNYISLPDFFPPSAYTVSLIETKIDGLFMANKSIYISSRLNIQSLAETLVHEGIHYINCCANLHAFKKTKQFIYSNYEDEVIAFTGEKRFAKNDSCLLRSDIKNIHNTMAKCYTYLIASTKKTSQKGYIMGCFDRVKRLETMVIDPPMPVQSKPVENVMPQVQAIPDVEFLCTLF